MKNKITILGNLIFDNWFLFVINTLIYIYSLYLELKYIFVDDFYRLSVYKRYGNEEEFLKFLSSERSLDFLNYLWMPIHVIGIALFTTICIFLGFNIMGIRLAFNKAFKYSLQASIVFSFNYLLLTLLKILGVVTYNYNTVDDVYFVQSLGRLFTRFNWPDWAYGKLTNHLLHCNCSRDTMVLLMISLLSKKNTCLDLLVMILLPSFTIQELMPRISIR